MPKFCVNQRVSMWAQFDVEADDPQQAVEKIRDSDVVLAIEPDMLDMTEIDQFNTDDDFEVYTVDGDLVFQNGQLTH